MGSRYSRVTSVMQLSLAEPALAPGVTALTSEGLGEP